MTFEEWWEKWQKDTEQIFFSYEKNFAEEAWDYQQARIDVLEAENRELGLQLITALVPDGYELEGE